MEKKQSVQFVQKARTIASFVKKNNHLFKQSSNQFAQFLCEELSKCKYGSYTYRIDNKKIQFFLDPYNDDGRNGGYLCCNILDLDNWDINSIFSTDLTNVKYYYKTARWNVDIDKFSLYDKVISITGREEERKVLYEWDKIIECMERCF